MTGGCMPMPGLLFGAYPERLTPAVKRGNMFSGFGGGFLAPPEVLRLRACRTFATHVGRLEGELTTLSQEAFDLRVRSLRAGFSRAGFAEPLLVEAFALIRHACLRVQGRRPFDTQLIAARIMLDNRVAEMATGEGKTLAAGVCALAGALAGVPVHVITVNDYLVERDARLLEPLGNALGLSVGYVAATHDVTARRKAYDCDITYCTAKELVFDYLRDRTVRNPHLTDMQGRAARIDMSPGAAPTLLRGLCMAIVDEADSVLIDEARIPLILAESRVNDTKDVFHAQALDCARLLTVGHDFRIDGSTRNIALTEAGRRRLEAGDASRSAAWHNRLHREETVCMALAALHLYRRDRHYLVQDGKVAIIDETTGRLAPGRVWSRGLHQMIEIKEGCATSADQVTAAQITYQRFFRRYLHIGGMSGTVREARGELGAVYGLEVVRVPLRRPGRRKLLPTRLYRDRAALWPAVIARAREVAANGRPVLVGTDSVAESEELSRHLDAAGLPHALLNARQDAAEAQTVARAGEAGRITVATNMAGRGTDIPLAAGVAERGGLHVICCQHNASRRIDRQLLGRAARQGDPGSAETMLALDKARLRAIVPPGLARRAGSRGLHRPAWLVESLVRMPQWFTERAQRRERRELLARDSRTERGLALMGALE